MNTDKILEDFLPDKNSVYFKSFDKVPKIKKITEEDIITCARAAVQQDYDPSWRSGLFTIDQPTYAFDTDLPDEDLLRKVFDEEAKPPIDKVTLVPEHTRVDRKQPQLHVFPVSRTSSLTELQANKFAG